MASLTIYDAQTGRIRVTCHGPDVADLRANVGPDEDAIEGDYAPSTHYIDAGVAVAIPPQPPDAPYWDCATRAWVAENPTPEVIDADGLAEIWASLRAERDRRINLIQWRVQRSNDERELGLPATEDRVLLLTYVQALRDLPETTTDPTAPVWPVMPEEA